MDLRINRACESLEFGIIPLGIFCCVCLCIFCLGFLFLFVVVLLLFLLIDSRIPIDF